MTAVEQAGPAPVRGRDQAAAVVQSLAAALLWAAYYLFILWATPGTAPSAIVAWPFAFGGAAFIAVAVGQGHGRALARIWATPGAWIRTGLLVTVQLSIVAVTYLAGPVDSSLLALIGDVVATPLVASLLDRSASRFLSRPWFVVGLGLSLLGGSLAIAGGHRLGSVPPAGWIAVVVTPPAIAFYFVLSAKAGERSPTTAVVGQSMLGAAVVTALLAPLLPGGGPGLLHVAIRPAALLFVTGLTSFCLAFILYFRAIARVGLGLPPMLMTGIPVFTLLLSAAFLGLGLPLVALLGVPVAVVGALLALRAERTPTPAAG
jgi:drug/metabolite transporter (DMT)-like permease